MGLRVGVDTGGTFTDLVAHGEESGAVVVHKTSSTPDDPGRAIVDGLHQLLAKAGGRSIGEVTYFAHGTTVGTNALLTGRGAKTGLITTKGFRDLLELGRGRRPNMYDLQQDKPHALVPRNLRKEVNERVRHDGRIETPIDPEEVRSVVRELKDDGVESIAVALLYSYVDESHEKEIGRIIADEYPEAYVSLSYQVLPEFREYERLSTVVTNAYIGPVMSRYLSRLRTKLHNAGLRCVPHVTQSNGGVIPFTTAEELPVRLVLSGPSTGVVGAATICEATGSGNIITFDMGGTSSDVSLVQHGQPKVTSAMELDGRPIRSPMLDIHTVGAGGGSIAWIDSGGHLRVGPQSAGAEPGPACYGRGDEATVTDANVVMQILNPECLLNGELRIDKSASWRVISCLADSLGLSVPETAQGIIRVVTANMARAIRVISVQRGYDPRDYALVPFGGAGPLHASRLAEELGSKQIIIPEIAGAQSALGLLMTDIRTDFLRTKILPAEPSHQATIAAGFAELESDALHWFDAEEIDQERRTVSRTAEMRYAGQNYELSVDVPDAAVTKQTIEVMRKQFEAVHLRLYGYLLSGEPIQVVTSRVQAIATVPRAEIMSTTASGGDSESAINGTRSTYFTELGDFVETPIYDRNLLVPGMEFSGPAIVEQMDTTTLVVPVDSCRVDSLRNLVVTRHGSAPGPWAAEENKDKELV